jgi:Zn-dependent protease
MANSARLKIARIFGIPVYLHLSWFVVFGLIVWTLATGYFPAQSPQLAASSHWLNGLVASLLLFLSIVLHELGHAWVARRSGIEIRSLTLFIFGGVAQLARDPEDGRDEVRMAFAGPIVSLALAALCGLVSTAPVLGASGRAVARYLALVNAGLALFNLVPAFPLDGGRVLRGLLWRSLGKARATRIAASSGSLFALFLIGMGVVSLLRGYAIAGMWHILIGWFVKEASEGAYSEARLDELLRGVTVRDAMLSRVETLSNEISVAEAARAHFLHTGYGGYPVLRGDVVVGLLCLRDVLRVPPHERDGLSVQAAMRPLSDAIRVGPDELLLPAMARMVRGEAGRLLVMENGRLIGLLTVSSVLRHVQVRQALEG